MLLIRCPLRAGEDNHEGDTRAELVGAGNILQTNAFEHACADAQQESKTKCGHSDMAEDQTAASPPCSILESRAKCKALASSSKRDSDETTRLQALLVTNGLSTQDIDRILAQETSMTSIKALASGAKLEADAQEWVHELGLNGRVSR